MLLRKESIDRWAARGPAAAPIDLEAKETDAARVPGKLELRERFLTADGQTATPLEQEALLGTNDLVESNFLDRCLCVSRPVCRVIVALPSGTLRATGFLVAPGLLLTNHHVLENEASAAATTIEFGYRYNIAGEIGSVETFDLAPGRFFVTDTELDFSAVAIAPRSRSGRAIEEFSYLRLHAETGKLTKGDFVTILQHPEGDPLQVALRENKVIQVDPDQPVIWYHADTAHGSSGAPVLNDSFQLVALHSSGRILRNAAGKYALRSGGYVDSLDGLKDADVIWEANVGIRVSRLAPAIETLAQARFPDYQARIVQAMSGGDVLASAIEAARRVAREPAATSRLDQPEADMSGPTTRVRGASLLPGIDGAVVIPLQLRVTLENDGVRSVSAAATSMADGALEGWKSQVPVIYDSLGTRRGFDPDFLKLPGNKKIGLPKLTPSGRSVAAPLIEGGGHELKYHKFSIVMHKARRLALFTAANVDWSDAAKKVNGHKPTRDELTEIPPNTIEQWVLDERIATAHQLPDRFYTDDRQAFDKGHLVRREDVCWGKTFADIQMANGDTYHVTNCTPQIEGFNRSGSGEENWGDFENEVGKQAKSEKLILFSGPVLDEKDRWFRGVDDGGSVRIQVPRRFWKIVVARGAKGAEAFGFVLEQDVVKITETEFVVSKTWKPSKKKISVIQGMLRGWLDLSALAALEKP